jgi:hypothetical protein
MLNIKIYYRIIEINFFHRSRNFHKCFENKYKKKLIYY